MRAPRFDDGIFAIGWVGGLVVVASSARLPGADGGHVIDTFGMADGGSTPGRAAAA